MPQVVAERTLSCSPQKIWAFVGEMDRWAPMLQGYVRHERQSETDSLWTLEGDLGPFTRTVNLAVHITENRPLEKIAFTLMGIGEDARGGGTFELIPEKPPVPAFEPLPPSPPRSWWQRLWDWVFGRPRAPVDPPFLLPQGPFPTRVVFTFFVEAGGPMGPMINALLGPFADEVAQDLVRRVATHLEETAG